MRADPLIFSSYSKAEIRSAVFNCLKLSQGCADGPHGSIGEGSGTFCELCFGLVDQRSLGFVTKHTFLLKGKLFCPRLSTLMPSHCPLMPSHSPHMPSHSALMSSHFALMPSHSPHMSSHSALMLSHSSHMPSHSALMPPHSALNQYIYYHTRIKFLLWVLKHNHFIVFFMEWTELESLQILEYIYILISFS